MAGPPQGKKAASPLGRARSWDNLKRLASLTGGFKLGGKPKVECVDSQDLEGRASPPPRTNMRKSQSWENMRSMLPRGMKPPGERKASAPQRPSAGLRTMRTILERLLLAHGVDDVVEEFFVAGLKRSPLGEGAPARPGPKGLDAPGLQQALALHGATIDDSEASEILRFFGGESITITAFVIYCEKLSRSLTTAVDMTDVGLEDARGSLAPPPCRLAEPQSRPPPAILHDDWLFKPIAKPLGLDDDEWFRAPLPQCAA